MAKSTRTTTRGSATPSRGGGGGGGRAAGRVYVATPQSDIYVTLLGVALGSMLLSIILLTLRLSQYEFKITP
jgi:hypothetical protein